MKLLPLIESKTVTARQVALALQQKLLNYDVLEDVELSVLNKDSSFSRVDGVTLHLKGPLVSFYLHVMKILPIFNNDDYIWTLTISTSKQSSISEAFTLLTTSDHDPIAWFQNNLIDSLMSIQLTEDTLFAYGFWFNKIAHNLPNGFTLFMKSLKSNYSAIDASYVARIISDNNIHRVFQLKLSHSISDELAFKLNETEIKTIEELNKLLLKQEEQTEKS